MTGKTLPENASLGQLRAQAKELRRACAGGSPAALAAYPAAFADWDSEASAEVLARIASRAGAADAAELKAAAVRAAEAVSGDEDRRICLERLAAEPW